MKEEIYEICRAAMFGQESLSAWSIDELEDKQCFIDWAFGDGEVRETMERHGYEEYSTEEITEFLSEVFDSEFQAYIHWEVNE